jgi:hypothetical protein
MADSSPKTSGNSPPEYSPGDLIRIKSGRLAGLAGKIALVRDSARCLVTIEGWPEGAYVMVPNESLERRSLTPDRGGPT